jgi:hypothetical protein
MVYGPGGYRFLDYVKFGMPLQIICAIISIGVILTMDVWWAWTVALFLVNVVAVGVAVAITRLRWKGVQASSNGDLHSATAPSAIELNVTRGKAIDRSESTISVLAVDPDAMPNGSYVESAGDAGAGTVMP